MKQKERYTKIVTDFEATAHYGDMNRARIKLRGKNANGKVVNVTFNIEYWRIKYLVADLVKATKIRLESATEDFQKIKDQIQ